MEMLYRSKAVVVKVQCMVRLIKPEGNIPWYDGVFY